MKKHVFFALLSCLTLAGSCHAMSSNHPSKKDPQFFHRFPKDPLYAWIFDKHLDLRTLFAMRRVNKNLKTLVDDYLEVAKDSGKVAINDNNYRIRMTASPKPFKWRKDPTEKEIIYSDALLNFLKRCPRRAILTLALFSESELNDVLPRLLEVCQTKLAGLVFTCKTTAENFKALKPCTTLRRFEVYHGPAGAPMAAIRNFVAQQKDLLVLELSCFESGELFENFPKACTNIEKIKLERFGGVDVAKISHLEKLASIYFGNRGGKIKNSKELSRLKKLRLFYNAEVDKEAVATLRELPELGYLSLYVDPQECDASFLIQELQQLKNLKVLYINGKKIKIFKSITHLKSHIKKIFI